MKNNRTSATVLIVIACVAAVFAVRALRPDLGALWQKSVSERSLGSDKAPLWITEYFDYQCPPCANARIALEQTMAEHSGQIYLQVRFFPLAAHKNALKAAVYAECASRQKGKFWKFHEEIFKHQAEWATDPYPQIKFAGYAEAAGLDLARIDRCAEDAAVEKAILDEKKKAEELGVKITPTFFVNGKLVVGLNDLRSELKAFFEKQAK